uniref:Secreted protein n=1 Tax=Amphilophus citrinellus TaxID=61819 RepID=A0A3Q0QXE0_AMPCI
MIFNCCLVFKTSLLLSSPLLSSPLRNYGGVYVGLPADLTTVAASQSKATRKGELQHTSCTSHI